MSQILKSMLKPTSKKNIQLIRDKQREIKDLNVAIKNIEIEIQNFKNFEEITVETCCLDMYQDANDISSLLNQFVSLNKDMLTDEVKSQLTESANVLSYEAKLKSDDLALKHKLLKQHNETIFKLQEEIEELVKEDFNLEESYIGVAVVTLKNIKEQQDIIVQFLNDNNIKFDYIDRKKIMFLNDSQGIDYRELIQDEIRKTYPDFNFKSLASNSNLYLIRNETIDLLYL